jgi:argininosuccinate synthase
LASLAGALHWLNDKSQEHVEGEVRLKLYKGNVTVIGRESPKSLYSSTLVTFEDDKGAYDQKDAAGFIKLNALRLRTLGQRDRKGVGLRPTSSCRRHAKPCSAYGQRDGPAQYFRR